MTTKSTNPEAGSDSNRREAGSRLTLSFDPKDIVNPELIEEEEYSSDEML